MTYIKEKFYPIIRLSKADILCTFEGMDNFNKVKNMVKKLTDNDMEYLAHKLSEDYCNQLYWDSLRSIFENKFLGD